MDILVFLLIILVIILAFFWWAFESRTVFEVWDKYLADKNSLTNKKD